MASELVNELAKCAAHTRPVSRLRLAVSKEEMTEIELEMRFTFGISHQKIFGIELIVDERLSKKPTLNETWD